MHKSHAVFKNNITDCFCICFVNQGEGVGVMFFKGSKRGMSLGLRGESRFLRDPKGGGVKKIL